MSYDLKKVVGEFPMTVKEAGYLLLKNRGTLASALSKGTKLNWKDRQLLSMINKLVLPVSDEVLSMTEKEEREARKDEIDKYIERQKKQLEYKLLVNKRALEKLDETRAIQVQRIENAKRVTEKLDSEFLSEVVMNTMRVIEMESRIKLIKHGVLQQLKLRQKIAGIEIELKTLETF